MDLTPNIGLGKPLVGEDYDIAVPNTNMDTLDATIHAIQLAAALADANIAAIAYVPWADFATTLTKSDGTVVAGTTIISSRYMMIGKTIFFKGRATNGAFLVDSASILLPTGAGRVPKKRELAMGTMVIDNVANTAQEGYARMTADKTKMLCVTSTAAFVDMPINSTIDWDVCYEVA